MPHTDVGELNFRWAFQLVDGFASSGITHAVISPGSRSTPLVLACEYHPHIQTHVILDERSAAFFALGLAKSTHKPVMVIATSGSAPAHWLPATIEASHSKVPLLLLTADRPPELLNTSANQTTRQNGLFADHVRSQHNPGAPREETHALKGIKALAKQAASRCHWPNPGPVHINLPFAEPLIPSTFPSLQTSPVEATTPRPSIKCNTDELASIKRELPPGQGIIICGPMAESTPEFTKALGQLSENLDAPVLADPLSGLRWCGMNVRNLCCNYDAFLRHNPIHGIDWILRFGSPPTSKSLLQLMDTLSITQVVCDPYGDWPDPLHNLTHMVRSDPVSLCEDLCDEHEGEFNECIRPEISMLEQRQQAHTDSASNLPLEALIIRSLMDQLPDQSTLLVGNSMPIRHMDNWSGKGSKTIHILGNRGVSGIDGHNATLAGLAEGSEQRCVGLFGDLTFVHDLNGLATLKGRNAVIIVLNNRGGGIFGYLPQKGLETFEKYWITPNHLDLQHAAALFDLGHQRCDSIAAFKPLLEKALESGTPQVLEVIIERDTSIQMHQDFWSSTPR